ncbi:lysosome-associated membrane glycoprotein 1 [Solea senegalensis]|uniref:Lysosome-associated membrane glycoprotein 5 n=1 Tax=Solea senegalensis TaxID=28829 RepID=A0AAV6Q4K2_SOLSE|nr:lysosome-associated membrane glycoprotein 1 [Solea senegalensis]
MNVCHALLAFTFACVSLPGGIQALTFEVKEGNSTCIKAELSVSFSITYNTSSSTRTVQLPLPDSSTVDVGRSTCGSDSSSARLVVLFGPGHALGLSFTTNLSVYSVTNLTLQYNLSDTVSFPDASSSVVVFEFTTSVGMWASTNTTYRCVSPTAVRVGGDTVTFSDVRLEAYMPGNDLSPTGSNDILYLSAPRVQTLSLPLLLGIPSKLNSSLLRTSRVIALKVTNHKRASALLDFTLKHSAAYTGVGLGASCWSNLTISSFYFEDLYLYVTISYIYKLTNIGANMTENAEKCPHRDSEVKFTALVYPAFRPISNRTTVLEVCQMDQDHMLIPIVVGAALAGLVLIVLIAYLIGRKRTHAGYQTI